MTRFVVLERRMVAELLAGGTVEVLAGELEDGELRALARAVVALRAVRQAPTEEAVTGIVGLLGGHLPGGEYEALMREGAMLRRAA